jgi:hypothetical protein
VERDGRPLSPHLRRLVVVGPFVLAVGLVLLFDVLRDIPPSYGCGEDEPAGHDAAVAAYLSGATALHLIAIAWALGGVALLSARGGRGPFGIGRPTAVALALVVVATPLALLANDSAGFLVILPLLLVVLGLVSLAEPFGAQSAGIIAAMLLLAVGLWAGRAVDTGRTGAPRAALWALVVLTGAHLLLVGGQGHGPFFC